MVIKTAVSMSVEVQFPCCNNRKGTSPAEDVRGAIVSLVFHLAVDLFVSSFCPGKGKGCVIGGVVRSTVDSVLRR